MLDPALTADEVDALHRRIGLADRLSVWIATSALVRTTLLHRSGELEIPENRPGNGRTMADRARHARRRARRQWKRFLDEVAAIRRAGCDNVATNLTQRLDRWVDEVRRATLDAEIDRSCRLRTAGEERARRFWRWDQHLNRPGLN